MNAKSLRLSRHAASQLAKTVTAHNAGVISAEQSSPAPVLSSRLVWPAQPTPRSRASLGGPSISWARDGARTEALTAASDAVLEGRPAASPCIRLPGPRHRCFAPSDGFPCPPPGRPVTPPLLAVSGSIRPPPPDFVQYHLARISNMKMQAGVALAGKPPAARRCPVPHGGLLDAGLTARPLLPSSTSSWADPLDKAVVH
ncbi:hypothetical protein HDV57DRAFT_312126 [Trichoderma longibrachiatum]|uniref:Uncharacterized protein n=1 Tax=Trichoderma longibrachiatum ATCC 18648 TaxID=983965 RepID=A0A2T4CBV1_TRILO|nr:hypothetical protein M440DRAFT_225916 [Trichoderma longibrachiatum ATCC 18648]